jgi:predicted dehydrogenase
MGATRRILLGRAAAFFGAGLAAAMERPTRRRGTAELRVGLVGCGGRGTAAAAQALAADAGARLVALADVFPEPLESALATLAELPIASQVDVPKERRHAGFEACDALLAGDLDVVLLATPPHFRPRHARAAVAAGKHVFAEKPGAVDAAGVRELLAVGALAREKGLAFVGGLNLRYLPVLREALARVHAGAIGEIRALHAIRHGGEPPSVPRGAAMGELEFQLRNWHHFTWLSGDFVVEQFVHQLDLAAWLLGERHPLRCTGTGGRQARAATAPGHVFDHCAHVFEYEGGVRLFTSTRQQVNCADELATFAYGSRGVFSITARGVRIEGEESWRPARAEPEDIHQAEQDALFAALRAGEAPDDAERLAKSTLTGILARQCAYTGQSLTFEQALASRERLVPSEYSLAGVPPPARVAVPGVTRFE